jgi:hypothetical protein
VQAAARGHFRTKGRLCKSKNLGKVRPFPMLKPLLLSFTMAAVAVSQLRAQEAAAPTEPSAAEIAEPTLEGGTAETSTNTATDAEAPATPAPSLEPEVELMPSNSGQLLPEPAQTTEPLPLIPEAPEPTERPRTTGRDEPRQEKKSSTEAASNEMKERIRFREAKTRASKDPAIQAEWERAHRVGTDYEKREILKNYYKMLYGQMGRIDKSLKKRILEQEKNSIRRLTQTRIDPTEPLDMSDRTEQFANQ